MHEAKMTKLKGETDNSSMIVGDFNNPLSEIDRTVRPKKSAKLDLN